MDGKRHNFAAACVGERIAFGASRPGYGTRSIDPQDIEEWVSYVRASGIQRVVCLLGDPDDRLVVEPYLRAFGAENVLHAPVADFTIPSEELIRKIIAFLRGAERENAATVVHCAGGIGRTAVVLTAWLIAARNKSLDAAVEAVCESDAVRDPFEAVGQNGITEAMIRALLEAAASM